VSQLNFGYLVDSEKQKRCEGFELRTDSWGAIRALKGMFISADGQTKAQSQGQVLAMQPAISNLGDAREQMTSISGDAQKATVNPADLQAKLLEQQLTDLKKSVLLLSAPDGMAMTSGQYLQYLLART
jgi:type VI secretion system secreted protein VgrG